MKRIVLRILARLRMLYRSLCYEHKLYVVVDGSDNSVTLSMGLVKDIIRHTPMVEGAIIVKLSLCNDYGLILKTAEANDIPMVYPLQYSAKYKSVGFESLTPMVNRVLADYDLPLMSKQTIAVKKMKFNATNCYRLCRRK